MHTMTRLLFSLALAFIAFTLVQPVQAQEAKPERTPAAERDAHLPRAWREWQPYQPPDTTERVPAEVTPEVVRRAGARPAARWISVDPLADEYPSWSPYNYVLGSPINYVDPNGMWVDDFHLHADGSMSVVVTGQQDRFFYDDRASGTYRALDLSNVGDRSILGNYLQANDRIFAHAVGRGRAGVSVSEQTDYFVMRQQAGAADWAEGIGTFASVIIEPVDWLMMGRDALNGNLHPGAALAALAPGASYGALKRAPEFLGGVVSESAFLDNAMRYLGAGYSEVVPGSGRYLSADGLRQVRYGAHEVNSRVHHGHFEAYDRAGGRVIENTRVIIR